jgi:hypothetical protein
VRHNPCTCKVKLGLKRFKQGILLEKGTSVYKPDLSMVTFHLSLRNVLVTALCYCLYMSWNCKVCIKFKPSLLFRL